MVPVGVANVVERDKETEVMGGSWKIEIRRYVKRVAIYMRYVAGWLARLTHVGVSTVRPPNPYLKVV